MSVYKRNKTWYISYNDANGCRIQRSAQTTLKHEAEELLVKLKHQEWKVKQLGTKPKRSWKDACIRWRDEKSSKKSFSDDLSKIRWLHPLFEHKNIDEITKIDIDKVVSKKRSEGATDATINRYLAFIKSILKCAKNEWDWIDRVPNIKLLKENTLRVRHLSDSEVKLLLKELPEHLKAMTIFSLATGLRKSNVTNLKWEQVNLSNQNAWIYADQAKAGKSIPFPLNDDAMRVLTDQKGKHNSFVFTYKGNPIKNVNTAAWKKALRRAGITNFRWHDLRHTWASNHILNGTPVYELRELGGWESMAMVQKYAHLTSEHLKHHSNNLPSFINK